MEVLDLYNNDLTGELPPEWGELASLRQLDLFGNDLTGELPTEWGSLPNLQRLDLGGNDLSGCLPYELAAAMGDVLAGQSLSVCVPQAPPPPIPPTPEDS